MAVQPLGGRGPETPGMHAVQTTHHGSGPLGHVPHSAPTTVSKTLREGERIKCHALVFL